MTLSIVVAYAKNRVIGKNNQLPWHLPADLKHFKAVTMGKPILMGRKTFESIGRPLPGRRNIVISREKAFDGCEHFQSIDAALVALRDEVEVMVIGGATIYTQLLPQVRTIYATEIDMVVDNGDAFFPEVDTQAWTIISEEKHLADEKNSCAYRFVTYAR